MFVQNLNREQQSILLHFAKEVAQADGSSDELQLGMVEILLKQSEDGITEKVISLDELPNFFDTEKAKCSLLLELLGIAHANEEYHLSERDLISQYANNLGISLDKLNALENWVEKQLVLSKEIETLLN
ncbi:MULTISPECIES: DNA repair protein [unclassified Pasteurella]|uniref:DNA repair protein n=1 Tax=unclassified Pasteurella TaxID=2621516 RepID=UPI001073145F|nr:DNA repair protein [Pasteurella sp. 19428wF3_WM03]TFU52564.1 DNA repair protein [Pasteurella sp. WM03]